MFGLPNMYILIGAGIIIAGLMGAIYIQKKWNDEAILKKDILINELNVRVATEKIGRKIAEHNVDIMRTTAQIQREERAGLAERLVATEQHKIALEKLFSRHDLDRLARRRPGLIERRINDGTQKVWDEFERITEPDFIFHKPPVIIEIPGESNAE